MSNSPSPTDHDLLRRFTAGDPDAFRTLVARHAAWVFSIARRGLGNSTCAEDATQAVFLLLAQKAAALSPSTILPAWLFQATHYAVKNMRRADRRRRYHEQKAAAMDHRPPCADPTFPEDLRTRLDQAVASLSLRDRTAILLRFYRRYSLTDIAHALGTTEEGARKQVARALHHLRSRLLRHHLPIAHPTLAAFLDTGLAEATPPGLIHGVATIAVSGTKAPSAILLLSHSIVKSFSFQGRWIMAFTAKTKVLAAAVGLLMLSTGTVVVYHEVARSQQVAPGALTKPLAVIDLGTPTAALFSVFSATHAEDELALARCMYAATHAETILNQAWVAGTVASARLNRAMLDQFGDEGLRTAQGSPWPDAFIDLNQGSPLQTQELPGVSGVLVGNDALGWARMIDDHGQWKLAMAQTYERKTREELPPTIQLMATAINALADDIAQGRCSTLAEARNRRQQCLGGRILLNADAITRAAKAELDTQSTTTMFTN